MSQPASRTAVFPGTFDPITNGHVDLIRRAAGLFDELVVAVGDNPEKLCLLSGEARAELVAGVVADLANVRVRRYGGLTVDLVREVGAHVILRGLRSLADLHFEHQVAHSNRAVSGVETLFMLPGPAVSFVSSGLVRQLARGGADVSDLVPPRAVDALRQACRNG